MRRVLSGQLLNLKFLSVVHILTNSSVLTHYTLPCFQLTVLLYNTNHIWSELILIFNYVWKIQNQVGCLQSYLQATALGSKAIQSQEVSNLYWGLFRAALYNRRARLALQKPPAEVLCVTVHPTAAFWN